MNAESLLQRQPQDIGRMFSDIAHRYDRMNQLMTAGWDRYWRREAVRHCRVRAGARILDLGTGTGELALALHCTQPATQIWATDISWAMMAQARRKPGSCRIRFAQADALQLPFPAHSFDAVVSGFVMRNLPDHPRALQEQIRVLRPGGRLVFLDILPPQFAALGSLFGLFFFRFVPWLGRVVTGSDRAYRYLPASTRAYPTPFAFLQWMREQGLADASFVAYGGNTVAIHAGTKAALSAPASAHD